MTVEYQQVAHDRMGEAVGQCRESFTPMKKLLALETRNDYST